LLVHKQQPSKQQIAQQATAAHGYMAEAFTWLVQVQRRRGFLQKIDQNKYGMVFT
jgi:hypothetical protein